MKNLPRRGFLPKILIFNSSLVACFLLLVAFVFLPKSAFAEVDCEALLPTNFLPTEIPKISVTFEEPNYSELERGKPKVQPAPGDENTTIGKAVHEMAVVSNDLEISDSGQNIGGQITIRGMTLPFAKRISDWLEGRFQDEDHRLANLQTQNSTQRHHYFGPLIKLTTQKQQDEIRRKYVEWVLNQVRLDNGIWKTWYEEATFEYSDVCGREESKRTIKALSEAFKKYPEVTEIVHGMGYPKPPSLQDFETKEEEDAAWEIWRKTWGLWWPKFPFYGNWKTPGCVEFWPPGVIPSEENEFIEWEECQDRFNPKHPEVQVVYTGVPDVLRLHALSEIAQQLIVSWKDIWNTRLVWAAWPQGPGDISGNPIYLYNRQTGNKVNSVTVNLTSQNPNPGGEATKALYMVRSHFPFTNIAFQSLVSDTGALRDFHPQGFIPKEATQQGERIYEDSARINVDWGFVDATADGAGTASELKVWAGFLGGVHNAKQFVMDALFPWPKKAL